MKKSVLIILLVAILLVSPILVSAEACDLDVSLINQDPYPAIPGDYVKIVFQIDGVSNPNCGHIKFELLEQYPLIFDPGENKIFDVNAGVYNKDFNSFLIAPYKVRIDQDALNGETPIEVQYSYGTNTGSETKQFNIHVENTRADFEVFVKDYNPSTKEITFEILNIAEADVEALTLEIPKQENIVIKGPKINIVGDLDSNEYTTADFEATAYAGEITLLISYIDSINKRRTIEKNVLFEPEYFEDRSNGKTKTPITSYLFWLLLIVWIVSFFWRRWKKKKKAKQDRKNKK
jgi:hypothetical protein